MVKFQFSTIPVLLICCLFLSLGIQAQELTTIDVLPNQVKLFPGEACKFMVQGYDRFYKETSFAPRWSASGGTVDTQGIYYAGQEEGVFFITVFDPVTGRQGTAIVTIKPREEMNPEQQQDQR